MRRDVFSSSNRREMVFELRCIEIGLDRSSRTFFDGSSCEVGDEEFELRDVTEGRRPIGVEKWGWRDSI